MLQTYRSHTAIEEQNALQDHFLVKAKYKHKIAYTPHYSYGKAQKVESLDSEKLRDQDNMDGCLCTESDKLYTKGIPYRGEPLKRPII